LLVIIFLSEMKCDFVFNLSTQKIKISGGY
jgi:hypothetical protein